MNKKTSKFMDKQIMDLSSNNTSQTTDFIDFLNRSSGIKNDAVPSYDFMPISRPTTTQSDLNSSHVRNYASVEDDEPETLTLRKNRRPGNESLDGSVVSEIDRTMKKYTDSLMNAMDGVVGRLSQLETRTGRLESLVDELKVSVGNSHGSADGKMRQLENILNEVHTGVTAIRDKQDILDAQLKIAKLNVSKPGPVESQNTGSLTQLTPSIPPPNASGHNNFPPAQLPNQVHPTRHQDPYFPPPGPTPEDPSKQYQVPPPQQQLPPYQSAPQPHNTPPALPQHQFQAPHQSQYSQTLPSQQPQPPFSTVNPQQPHHPEMSSHQPPPAPFTLINPSPPHRPEETPYPPTQSYPPAIHTPSHPSQQYYGPPPGSYDAPSNRPGSYDAPSNRPGSYDAPSNRPGAYDAPSNRPGSGYSAGPFGPSSGHGEPYPYSNSPTKYGSGSPMKGQQQHSSPFTSQGGGSGYPQLPTARILPQALPTASNVGGGSGSGSGGSGNKASVDDVVEKVANMGFSRDQVRAAVRRLTENGQPIDLNVVLDKVMNE